MESDLRDFAERWQLAVKLLAVLLHNIVQVLIAKSHRFGFVIVGMNQSDESFTLLYDKAFADHCHGIELIFNLLGIDVLTV